jgi:hypothetical protein
VKQKSEADKWGTLQLKQAEQAHIDIVPMQNKCSPRAYSRYLQAAAERPLACEHRSVQEPQNPNPGREAVLASQREKAAEGGHKHAYVKE